jgi:WhiB family redox-sensing transcriptional regulator
MSFVLDGSHLDWATYGACNYQPRNLMYTKGAKRVQKAKKVCATCPVAAECLEWAIENDEIFGIWGGMTRRERMQLVKEAKESAQ